jgi:outer membrane protein assembly factor BamE (lipoprotein component of BamABCDE complex)
MTLPCMTWLRSGAISLFILLGSGCLYIPTAERYSQWGPQGFTEETIASLKPGITTRSDVLQLFGEPYVTASTTPVFGRGTHLVDKRERFYVYQWETHKGFMFALFAGVGPMRIQHFLCLDFAPDTTLRRFAHIHPQFFIAHDELEDQVKEWQQKD